MKAAGAIGLAVTLSAFGADPDVRVFRETYDVTIDELVKLNNTGGLTIFDNVVALVDVGRNQHRFFRYARGLSLDYQLVEEARTDKQVGSPSSSSGSTNLVSKGAVPKIFGFAVENGALTQSVSGTTTTLRGNLVGWLDLAYNQKFIDADDIRGVRHLRRVSYSFSLDSSRTAAATAQPAGSGGFPSLASLKQQIRQTGQQLSNYSVRVALWDRRDPRTPGNRAEVDKLATTHLRAVMRSENFMNDFYKSDFYAQWLENIARKLSTGGLTRREIAMLLYSAIEELRTKAAMISGFEGHVAAALDARAAYENARLGVFKKMNKQPLVSFEYVNQRLPTLPDISTFRWIAEGQFGPLDLTANAAFTRQNKGAAIAAAPSEQNPTAVSLGGRTRDIQFAAQGDLPLGRLKSSLSGSGLGLGNMSVAFAYLSRRLSEKTAVEFAGYNFLVDPGWIHVAQAKLTIPIKGSGIKIPLSVSAANRTELIREKDVRANIGVTFDLDSIMSGFFKK